MFDDIRARFNTIIAYSDVAKDDDWILVLGRIKSECEAAKLELEELEFQMDKEA